MSARMAGRSSSSNMACTLAEVSIQIQVCRNCNRMSSISGNVLLSSFEDETIYMFLEGKAFCLLAERKIQNSLSSSH